MGNCRDSKYYCNKCRKYYKTKRLFLATRTDVNTLIKRDKIKIDDINMLKEFMDKHKVSRKNKGNYEGLLMYCPDCKKSQLIIKNSHYDTKEKKVFMEKSVDVDKSWVKVI